MTPTDLARRLHQLGHAPEFPEADERFLAWARQDWCESLLERYQRFHRLPVSGQVCPETEAHLARPRCAHPDVLALGSESRWALPTLEYFQQVAYPNVAPEEVAADYAEGIRRMTAVCGITVNPTSDPSAAQILATSGPIDGRWNVLALTELPPPAAGQGVILHQTFDAAETDLTKEQRIAMNAHECGHFLGLGHAVPGSGNLMEPVLSSISSPQAGDTAELQGRYGPFATSPARPPADTSQAGPPATSVVLTIASPGSHRFDFGFDSPGRYLVLIVRIDEDQPR